MTYTTTSPITPLYKDQLANVVATATAQLKRLSVEDQLALLWLTYTEMGRSITPAAPGAARLQFAEGLLNQFRQMSRDEQLQAMRDLVNKVNTPICRAYGILSVNTKLAFWYTLAQMMEDGIVIPVPSDYRMSSQVLEAFDRLQRLEFGQQITVLRNVVVDMGVDPLA